MLHTEIFAITKREIKKSLADKWFILISIASPLIFIFVLGKGIDSFVDIKNLGMSYTDFLGPGVIAIMCMGGAVHIGNSIIEDKKGFIREMLVAPVSRASIFIGKILGEMAVYFSLTFIVIIIFLAIVKSLSFTSLFWAAFFMILITFGFYGLGAVLSFLFKRAKTYQVINSFVMMYIVFLSGAFFPHSKLPRVMMILSALNPLTYGVDGLRWALTSYKEFSIFFDIIFLALFGILMIFIGAYSFKKTIET
ncbi:MAG: ABC transporter permease [Candidatus Woesearchaeota archaeon]